MESWKVTGLKVGEMPNQMWFTHSLQSRLVLYNPSYGLFCKEEPNFMWQPANGSCLIREPHCSPNIQVKLQNFLINRHLYQRTKSSVEHSLGLLKLSIQLTVKQILDISPINLIIPVCYARQIIQSDRNIWSIISKGFSHQSQIITSLWVT